MPELIVPVNNDVCLKEKPEKKGLLKGYFRSLEDSPERGGYPSGGFFAAVTIRTFPGELLKTGYSVFPYLRARKT